MFCYIFLFSKIFQKKNYAEKQTLYPTFHAQYGKELSLQVIKVK